MPQIGDSVLPIVEAGKAVFVDNDYAINDHVWFESPPGHTPDHVSVRLSSNGADAVITGDMMHCPVQCTEPMWLARPDYDPEQARQTRRSFLERYCETDVLVCATHFPPRRSDILCVGDMPSAFSMKHIPRTGP